MVLYQDQAWPSATRPGHAWCLEMEGETGLSEGGGGALCSRALQGKTLEVRGRSLLWQWREGEKGEALECRRQRESPREEMGWGQVGRDMSREPVNKEKGMASQGTNEPKETCWSGRQRLEENQR